MSPGFSDRDDLFRAILADPADDAPRLVFADWLDEHGEPDRAEFIRLQCEIETRGRRTHPRLIRRVQQLQDAHGSRWRLDLPDHPNLRWYGFRRGFIDSATVDDTTGLGPIAEE